jgi:uncharacterized protein YndB with AHSA1/START domain
VTVVDASVDIQAPPEEVWRIVADPHNLPTWDRHIAKVEGIPPDGLRPGTRYTTEVRFMGVRAHSQAKVLEIRPPEYSKIQLSGLLDGVVETWLEALDGGHRTRLRHRIKYRFKGGPLGEVAARAVGMFGAAAVLRRGVLAQKRQVENPRS